MKMTLAEGCRPNRARILAAVLCLFLSAAAGAQQTAPTKQPATGQTPAGSAAARNTKITPDQARQLFASVDEIMKFSSDESGLPIKNAVKRQLISRTAVKSYLEKKFNDDKDSRRMERDQIVLKKFGLLDRDFQLKPFLLALLNEQIEAYYDTKTKTINLLDWVQPDEQKPVLAHELTHALQDQHSNLEKWDDQTPDDVSKTAAADQVNLAKDEIDTARDAVTEGQATAVMMDYILKPMGKSLVKDPEVLSIIRQHMSATADSPVMSRAPLLLSESMLFPYRDGLSFEQDIWMDEGRTAAFTGVLDRPPTSTWEILNPRYYEQKLIPPLPLLPNFHPLVDKLYRPYDIGQIGELDIKIMTQLYGGDHVSRDLTPAWDGGLYWAGQLRSDTAPAEQNSTKSLAIFSLVEWRNAASALEYAKIYADNLGRKYASVEPDTAANDAGPAPDGSLEQVFTTDEGPVVITTRGKLVFVAESFPLDVARKLTSLILNAQGGGEMQMTWNAHPGWPFLEPASLAIPADQLGEPLSGGLVRFFSHCGVMKAVVNAEMESAVSARATQPAK